MKNLVNNLTNVSDFLTGQDEIFGVSSARNGVIKLVFDLDFCSESEVQEDLKQAGINKFSMNTDTKSNTLVIEFKNV